MNIYILSWKVYVFITGHDLLVLNLTNFVIHDHKQVPQGFSIYPESNIYNAL